MVSLQQLETKEAISRLKTFRGKGTRLVSLYIPAGYPLPEIVNKLRSEISEASNIKSKQTRKNVVDALEKIVNFLKHFKKTPDNGLAVFSGNVSDDPSKEDIRLFYIEPPMPLNIQLYRCDSFFYTEPLEKMLENKKQYGVLLIDGKEATVAILRGSHFTIVKQLNNPTHQKIRKGGQSSRRFQRLIEEGRQHYFRRVGEAMNILVEQGITEFIVAGPGPAKEDFLKERPFDYRIKILGTMEVGYTDETGMWELLEKIEEVIKDHESIREKELVNDFLRAIAKNEKVAFGQEVLDAVEQGRAALVLVSEEFPYYVDFKDGKPVLAEKGKTIYEYLKDKGVDVEIISTGTQEGQQFLMAFKGLGAFLHW